MKIVKDDWEFKVESKGGKLEYSAHYAVESEGVSQKRGTSIWGENSEETQISNFIMNVVRPKVEAHENGF